MPLMYDIPWSMSRNIAILQMIIVSFVNLATSSMLFTYLIQIRGKIVYLVQENIKLLDKVHHGLIVVKDSETLELKFASEPAVRLIK